MSDSTGGGNGVSPLSAEMSLTPQSSTLPPKRPMHGKDYYISFLGKNIHFKGI